MSISDVFGTPGRIQRPLHMVAAHRGMAESDPTTESLSSAPLALLSRRHVHAALSLVVVSPFLVGAACADDFVTTPSGLKVLDIRLVA